MKTYNALVTGIGTIIGYGIINSLKESSLNVNVIGMDMNPEAIGRIWCDKFIIATPASSSTFANFLINTIKEYDIDIVFLGTEQELHRIAELKTELGMYYDKIVINNSSIINISEDKWDTYNFLVENNVKAIESHIEGSYSELKSKLGTPFLLKPRRSYSSRGVVKVSEEENFNFYKKKLGDQFMAQRFIGDENHEYTASTFAFGDGTCITPIIMKRKLSFEGATLTATIEWNDEIEKNIRRLVSLLKPIGPTNFQYRMENGECYLLETNPRISSATSLRTAFGYNEAEMSIRFFVNKEEIKDANIKGGKATRYISDYVELL